MKLVDLRKREPHRGTSLSSGRHLFENRISPRFVLGSDLVEIVGQDPQADVPLKAR